MSGWYAIDCDNWSHANRIRYSNGWCKTMPMHRRIIAYSSVALASFVFSCSDDTQPDPNPDSNVECQELGDYCHDAGQLDAQAQECHELMHEAEDGCMDRYDECKSICQTVLAGAGGAAGNVGNVKCQELGAYCHDAGELDADAQECHEIMHEAEDGCMDRYDECKAICEAVLEGASGSAGAGGAAGAGGNTH
jgi:hypothetical protein